MKPCLSPACSHHNRAKNTAIWMQTLGPGQAPHPHEAMHEPRMKPCISPACPNRNRAKNTAIWMETLGPGQELLLQVRLSEAAPKSRMLPFLWAKNTVFAMETLNLGQELRLQVSLFEAMPKRRRLPPT